MERARIPAGGKKIVLAGNPNVGKSVFFNILTGSYVDVSNYPGTTLEMACGRYRGDVVIDTPGVYGISSYNEEEKITRDIVLSADIVINIVDAANLERDLFLTLQLMDMGVPAVVALNMVDEAIQRGFKINVSLLEKFLGVPVVPTVAVRNIGMNELKRKIYFARPGNIEPLLLKEVKKVSPPADRREALLILEGDAELSERYCLQPGKEREKIYRSRREMANRIVAQTVRETGKRENFAARLGRWMIIPVTGFPILLIALWLIYELIGVLLAGHIVQFTENVMKQAYEPAVRSLLGGIVPPGSVFDTVLAGRYGLLTATATYLIGLLLPLVLGIFLALSILEDTGYLPRIATLTDRVLAGMGLNGQAVIPFILGFGCVTMACISTRLLSSDRERRIAIFLLALGIPCSAQMAVNVAVIASMGFTYMLLFFLFLFTVLLGAGVVLGRLLPGGTTPLLIELPPLRLPIPQNIIKKASLKSYYFIKEALPLFAGGMLFMSLLDAAGLLQGLRSLLVPVTVGWLHLPAEIADIFIMGLIRKEFGAAAILSLNMSHLQNFVALITLTLTVPCIASTMVVFKERGVSEGLVIWIIVFSLAFFIGGVVARILEVFDMPGSLRAPVLAVLIIVALAGLVFAAGKLQGKNAG
ncbi:MAG TPA: ferrous iron transport protein B [Bacillota bacterium]|nr:ferrous iron transport protein B [Bacillota bacterium]